MWYISLYTKLVNTQADAYYKVFNGEPSSWHTEPRPQTLWMSR